MNAWRTLKSPGESSAGTGALPLFLQLASEANQNDESAVEKWEVLKEVC